MTTNDFKQIIMENVFKLANNLPSAYYIGLSTGANLSGEPASSTGYARVALTGKLAYDSTNHKIVNSTSSGEITFDNSSGSSDWFSDSSKAAFYIITNGPTVGGNTLLAYGQLTTAKSILAGDTAKIAQGALQISISDLQ